MPPRPKTGAASRHTYNPALHFDVLLGEYDIDFFLNRTLSFTLEDRAQQYDQFTWRLDNRDGALTDLSRMALGLLLRIRLGYADDTKPWRTFIVSRMSGGVGVKQKEGDEMAAVGSNESVIEYSGRNRNAPDLRGRKTKGRSTKSPYRSSTGPTGRGGPLRSQQSRGGATSDVTKHDNVSKSAWHGPLEAGETRIFNVRHLSDAVREIARRWGYPEEKIFVEDTNDEVDNIVIPVGMTDADFIQRQAEEKLGWRFKFSPKGEFHFHSKRWSPGESNPTTIYNYGGPDVLQLNVDFDFRLPVPKKMKGKGYNPILRGQFVSEEEVENSPIENKVAIFAVADGAAFARFDQRNAHLYRNSVVSLPGGSNRQITDKVKNGFINRHIRAVKISLVVVGDPNVDAGDIIGITGTGSPLVDGYWYAETIRHVFSGTTYVTEFDLRAPSKKRRNKLGRILVVRGDLRDPDATSKNLAGYAQVHVKGREAALRRFDLLPDGNSKTGGK